MTHHVARWTLIALLWLVGSCVGTDSGSDSGDDEYIDASDQAELEAALDEIVVSLVSCVYQLGEINDPDVDMSKVNFYFITLDDDDDNDNAIGYQGVDFLFVIDNSRSMKDEQENLINSFPGFIAAITEVIEIDDYHIMAVDSDARYGSPGQGNCDNVLGSGHVGQNTNGNCQIQGGNRYLIEDQTDLNGTFACIADVGTDGNGYEKLMEAMVNAVGQESGAGGCNADFIRDDAILVVTFITDEDEECTEFFEDCSSGTPQSWKQGLVDAKGGNGQAIVVLLGVFGDNDMPNGICTEYDENGDGAMPAPLLQEFLLSFDEDHRQYCSVCLSDYSDCFLKAVSIIDSTCDDMIVE